MTSYEDKNVVSGSWGEIWIDSDYVAEATGLEAKVTIEKTEVNKTRRLTKGYKVIGYEGKGTLKFYKVSSRMIEIMSDNMKKGKQTTATIITKLSDPDAGGEERIRLNNCTFDELTLANWESKKIGEESVPFTFTDWDVLDTIKTI